MFESKDLLNLLKSGIYVFSLESEDICTMMNVDDNILLRLHKNIILSILQIYPEKKIDISSALKLLNR
jgi:hypothetical protein